MTDDPQTPTIAVGDPRPWDVTAEEGSPKSSGLLKFKEGKPKKSQPKNVRHMLARGLLLLISVLSLIGAVSWFQHSNGDIQSLVVLMSPITTLAGGAFAFYFADSKRKD